ncbi:MAG: DNA topoisomerase I [Asgard group archaeon]|nr:DNA topoisomerase I [Asgard group archaeon]
MTEITELIHNGVKFIDTPFHELSIEIDGKPHKLTPKQEQMAIAWVRKLSTVYVEDEIFCKNFFEDFSKELDLENLTDDNIDFSEVINHIEAERAVREAQTKEEKKALREQRKVIREEEKAHYGSATLNGELVEISNYTAEPSSIFMGRGEHPMRGKWKEGPVPEDIVLNISDHDKIPPGNWKEIVWEPECLWIAKWVDKLSGKTKYVWLSDNTPIKQQREIDKFDKSKLVGDNLQEIRNKVIDYLKNDSIQKRKIALACYIIDNINMRVGDEKDEDEADTIGTTTLRPEHVTITGSNVTFNFLGKDSVEWNKEAEFPAMAVTVLEELITIAKESGEDKPQIFSDIGSRHVNTFLGDIVEGLTAKIFRTYHATHSVYNSLEESDIDGNDPEFLKKEAAVMANLEAAVICNHIKQISKTYANRLQKFRERKLKANDRIDRAKENQKKREERLEELKQNLKLRKKQSKEQELKLEEVKINHNVMKEQNILEDSKEKTQFKKQLERSKKKVESQKKRVEAARKRIDTAKNQVERGKNSLGTAKERVYKANMAFKKIESQERVVKKTKNWNLGTSLKSYIDPRIYRDWGKDVDYDWKSYYTKTLQKKFSWLDSDEND